MKISAGLLILFACACMPYMVWADGTAAAAAAAASGGGAAAAAAAASSSVPEYTIHCKCNAIYDPVCSTDGYTYSNQCVLRCVSEDNMRNGRPAIGLHHKGECRPVSCICPQVYQPVCGKNGQTYGNECYLNCENAARIKNGLFPIKIAYHAACRNPTCKCSDVIIPVCGTNGKTYRNVCILQYYSRVNQAQNRPPIFLKHSGACKNEACDCSLQKNELCASDENTYLNDCMLRCQNRRRNQLGQPPLTIQYRGKCIRCPCPKNYAPVCANNDVTFSNLCLFLCENKRRQAANRPLLYKRWNGRCDCNCSINDWYPVCASNRKTYRTRCALRCENRKRAQDGLPVLSILNEGVCRCDCRHCGDLICDQVCGSDWKTYCNICWLRCTSDCRVASGQSPLWKRYNGKC